MVVVGAAFVVFWFLADLVKMDILTAAIVTGVAFILIGLVLGDHPWTAWHRP